MPAKYSTMKPKAGASSARDMPRRRFFASRARSNILHGRRPVAPEDAPTIMYNSGVIGE